MAWREADIADVGVAPAPRNFHTATLMQSEEDGQHRSLYIIGGTNGIRFFDDIHVLNLRNIDMPTWKKITVRQGLQKDAFIGRSRHTAVRYNTSIIIFGGVRGGNDVMIFDTVSKSWQSKSSAGAIQAPSPRFGHCSITIGRTMLIFGGHTGVSAMNDLYTYDLAHHKWTSIPCSGQAKIGSTEHMIDPDVNSCSFSIDPY